MEGAVEEKGVETEVKEVDTSKEEGSDEKTSGSMDVINERMKE